MKIGIIGNMNNMYFSLARFLADEGYDCVLMLFDYEPAHFHPSADTNRTRIPVRVKKLSWGDPAHFLRDNPDVAADIAGFDFLIGNGSAPAFLHKQGRRLDLFIPYGDDLYALPFLRVVHPLRQMAYFKVAHHQMEGIRQCPALLFDRASDAFEKVFERIGYTGRRITMPPPLFYHPEYDHADLTTGNPYALRLQELRTNNDLLIVQHIRQVWRPQHERWTRKGNDILFRGFAAFVEQNPMIRTRLILFDYGSDVKSSKRLIHSLGIDDRVDWFPKMERRHLMAVVQACDLVAGEMRHSWNTYCVVAETLASSKVLMHKRTDAEVRSTYSTLYPMLHAASPNEVVKALTTALRNADRMKLMGEEGRAWYLENNVQRPLSAIVDLIKAKQTAHE